MRQQGGNLYCICNTLAHSELHSILWFIFTVAMSREGFITLAKFETWRLLSADSWPTERQRSATRILWRCVRLEAFMAVRMMMMMMIFCVATPYRLVGRYQRFGETYCVHFEGSLKMETVCFSEMLAYAWESTRRHNLEDHHHLITLRKAPYGD
jgi:hypothetical protein